MKKILLIIIVTLFSCKKETKKPSTSTTIQNNCNCGRILSDNPKDYSVEIRNSCTNNIKTFYLTEGDWMNAYVGQDYCITNVSGW